MTPALIFLALPLIAVASLIISYFAYLVLLDEPKGKVYPPKYKC